MPRKHVQDHPSLPPVNAGVSACSALMWYGNQTPVGNVPDPLFTNNLAFFKKNCHLLKEGNLEITVSLSSPSF